MTFMLNSQYFFRIRIFNLLQNWQCCKLQGCCMPSSLPSRYHGLVYKVGHDTQPQCVQQTRSFKRSAVGTDIPSCCFGCDRWALDLLERLGFSMLNQASVQFKDLQLVRNMPRAHSWHVCWQIRKSEEPCPQAICVGCCL